MKKMLVAVDWSEHSERAVELASDLASTYGAKLIAVHVISDEPLPSAERHLAEVELADEIKKYPGSGLKADSSGSTSLEMMEVFTEHRVRDRTLRSILGETLLKRAMRAAHNKGVKTVETALTEGNVAESILRAAKDNDVDLIVLGSRGMGTLGEMFLGSISHKVNQLSDISVVTVK